MHISSAVEYTPDGGSKSSSINRITIILRWLDS